MNRSLLSIAVAAFCLGGPSIASDARQVSAATGSPIGATPSSAPPGIPGSRDAGAAALRPSDVDVASFLLPPSSFMSPEARAVLAKMLAAAKQQSHGPRPRMSVAQLRAQREKELQPLLSEAKRLYPVDIVAQTLGGVAVDVVTPKNGVAPRNRRRVLIELAGGAFTTATPAGGILASIPVAVVGGYRVINVQYRQGPEYRFPAASEDVAAVYKALLRTYEAKAIGIYGCSSGAWLTGMSLAWFQTHDLPTPGAAALLCGSAGRIFDGDSFFTGAALMGHPVPKPPTPGHPVPLVDYMRDAESSDPLASPINFPEVLAKFPPTLFITGTRDIALSSASYMHRLLAASGVKTDLYVWNGMWHGFMNYTAMPETRQAAEALSKFFDEHLSP